MPIPMFSASAMPTFFVKKQLRSIYRSDSPIISQAFAILLQSYLAKVSLGCRKLGPIKQGLAMAIVYVSDRKYRFRGLPDSRLLARVCPRCIYPRAPEGFRVKRRWHSVQGYNAEHVTRVETTMLQQIREAQCRYEGGYCT
jgi:hypothetical protein